MEDIILIGAGGHCKSIIDSIESSNIYNIIGILDDKENLSSLLGYKILGKISDLKKIYRLGIKKAFISIGSIGDTSFRRTLDHKLTKLGFDIGTVIDSSATISRHAIISKGTFIGKNSIINACCTLGRNSIINSGTILDHDCKIGDFCHIAPGSVLCGSVIIGDNTHIGTNSTIIQGIIIEKNSLIGAGSIITKNIPSNTKAYGNPLRIYDNYLN